MKTKQALMTATFGLWIISTMAFEGLDKVARPGSNQDPSSSSNVDAFAPSHLELGFLIDFDTSSTFGTITHHLTVLEADTTTVFMDVWDNVEVSQAEIWTSPRQDPRLRNGPLITHPKSVTYKVTTPNNNTGKALGVDVPRMAAGTTFYLRLTFRSFPGTRALTWLKANETVGKTMPFVYSLCEMNNCRDWMPLFDTPSSKVTYKATVTAPSGYVVHMSGNKTNEVPYNQTWMSTIFESTLKMPTYQISLIAGHLESVDLGGRIKVFAEPPLIEQAVEQFRDLPAFLVMAEEYLTPYIWGDCSVFVMPPGYFMGGMEHINAIQLAPSILSGDDSEMYIAIHEITHSWFGNEVTCKNWNSFWINEGMNTFAHRKIQGLFYGINTAKEAYYFGNQSMGMEMMMYGLNSSYSSLFPDVQDQDPHTTMSTVTYDKGAQFMYHHIESLLGEDKMQAMLRDYIHEFSQKVLDEFEFQQWYNQWVTKAFPSQEARDIIVRTQYEGWVYEPGFGPVTIDFKTEALEDAEELALEYVELNATASPLHFSDYLEFTANQQRMFFLQLSNKGVTPQLLVYINNDLGIVESLNNSLNIDVVMEWAFLVFNSGGSPCLLPNASEDCDPSTSFEDMGAVVVEASRKSGNGKTTGHRHLSNKKDNEMLMPLPFGLY